MKRPRASARERARAEEPRPLDAEGMEAAIRDFLESLSVRNYSAVTVKGREYHLLRFSDWCAERSLLRPSEITRPILERYQRWLFHYRRHDGRPISFRSQAQTLTAVRGLFRFLARQGRILMNPAADLDMPKEEKRLPRVVLTAQEADQILNQPNVHDLLGLRDRAILETLYSTGIRRTELVNLLVHDLDVNRETVFVRLGKGKKDRIVPIGERALAWTCKYLYEARPRIVVEPDCGRLFLSREGGPIAPATLTELVSEYVLASGVGKTGACHIFRHTMATLMLEGGADIRFIQEMLGHANLQTTQIYTRVSIQKLKAIHDATHPGAKLRPAAARAAEVKTEAESTALLQALDAEAEDD
jgi:integrase/recombinase XerD